MPPHEPFPLFPEEFQLQSSVLAHDPFSLLLPDEPLFTPRVEDAESSAIALVSARELSSANSEITVEESKKIECTIKLSE